jgi:hypothetical protein
MVVLGVDALLASHHYLHGPCRLCASLFGRTLGCRSQGKLKMCTFSVLGQRSAEVEIRVDWDTTSSAVYLDDDLTESVR